MMWLIALALIAAFLSMVAAIRAIRAWLRYRRARIELRDHLTDEVANLLSRTGEMEENLASLETRSQELPIQIAELQESLTTLRILTSALTSTLRQVSRVLSFDAIKTLSAVHLSNLLPSRSDTRNPG
ncbi:hypothetical protein BH18ACT10_BH18ACT10_17000 [soil metagenome]